MFIPLELLEIKHIYTKDEQEYLRHKNNLWYYNKWAKRANKQMPNLAARIFALRGKTGFYNGIERTLGRVLIGLTNVDECPMPPGTEINQWFVKTLVNELFRLTVKLEREG
jgi:hypothetical protein